MVVCSDDEQGRACSPIEISSKSKAADLSMDKPKLFRRREIWLPTWRGLLGFVLLLMLLTGLLAVRIHPFLAPVMPVTGGDLVAEGWLSDHAFVDVSDEFRRNHYRTLYVTGGPIGISASFCGYANFAELGAAKLRSLGVPADRIRAVPAPPADMDRTYVSALALREWQKAHGVAPVSYHLMTEGAHARRSWMMFRAGLGEGATLGVTAIADENYDPERWWKTSAGVRSVISESIAYAYARLIFPFRQE